MGSQETPFDATPAALHFRLKAVEDKIDDLPDEIIRRLEGKLQTQEGCRKAMEGCALRGWGLPWGKMLAALLIALTAALTAYSQGGPPAKQTQEGAK